MAQRTEPNPFLAPSVLPYALPPFDKISHEHYLPAIEAGMAEQRDEVAVVGAQTDEPTFVNTIEALERSGRTLTRVLRVYDNLSSSMSTEQMQALETEVAPLLAAHEDAIRLDPELFARVDAVHASRMDPDRGLDPAQVRVAERYHQDFLRSGAALGGEQRDRLRALNARLTSLTTEFGSRLLGEANRNAVHLTDRAQLDGLTQSAVDAAGAAAEAAGLDGYLLPIRLPTIQPAISSLTDRDVRRRLFEAATTRGTAGGPGDTRELVSEIVSLRAERAALLGFENHAAYVVDDQTAGTSKAVLDMLNEMVCPAMRNLEAERQRIERLLHEDGVEGPVEPWDWSFYAARDLAATFDLDKAALTPYFEFERVLGDGIFYAAHRLYGLTFTERHDLPVYADGVRVFEVFDRDGSPVGLFVCDWFARPTKRGGAWMSEFVGQSHLLDSRPVVVVCHNVPRPPPGKPALMTVEEVRTGFHEFGHALHGLFSDVVHPRLHGTAVPRDFVEFPSQVNEMWAWHPDVLANYAVHHETGQRLPQQLVDRLLASQQHDQGFETVSMLGAALLDQAWHRHVPGEPAPEAASIEDLEAAALEAHGVRSALVPPRYRTSYFAHIFEGGYDAGYYAYLWSEVLDADMVGWFHDQAGAAREAGDTFRRELLSVGGTVDPLAAFRAVRGRDPSLEPLLRRRGLRD